MTEEEIREYIKGIGDLVDEVADALPQKSKIGALHAVSMMIHLEIGERMRKIRIAREDKLI